MILINVLLNECYYLRKDHICNRYCGGSHTVTTPQQRVTRLGHFLTQWGPETIKCSEAIVKGTDGQFYKADLPEEKKDEPRTTMAEGGDATPKV